MAKLIDAGIGSRTPGEQRALDTLKTLPKSWFVIANKMLPLARDQSLEIDMIVVGEHRVFVIDEKSWGGQISGTDQSWQLHGNQLVGNPLNKVEHVVRRLASHLRATIPGFPMGGRVIGARVLLSSPSAKAQLRDPRAQDQVLTLANVVDRLMKQDAEGQSDAYLTPLHGAIEGVLYAIPARPEHPARIEPYRIDELLKRLPGCRVYRATHPEGGARVLFVYDPPGPGATPAEVERVHREAETLRSLQGSGVVPVLGDSLRWNEDYEVVPMHVPDGRPLGTLPPPASPRDAVQEIRRAAAAFGALARIHAAGIVHRAIGPDAVIVLAGEDLDGAPPRVVLTGFMSARKPDNTTIAADLDAAGITDPYVAPEIAKLASYGFAEAASDVYSLALVLLERLAGVPLAKIVADAAPGGQATVPTAPGTDRAWPFLDEATVEGLRGQFAAALRAGPLGAASDPNQIRPGSADLATALRSIADAAHQRLQPDTERLYDRSYRVIRELGAGASARTLLVEHVELHEHYAAKLYFQPGALAEGGEALREYRLLWKHPHDNLPRPAKAPSPQDELPLLLEWIDGPTLRNALPRFARDRVAWLALAHDLCAAVGHLETHTLLHRDIKPENILIKDENGRAYLIDYGGSAELAAPGTPAGTYRYLPPEWFSAETHPATSDRYALAVTLYEALTGELPFVDQSAADRTPALAPPASLPEDLHGIAQVLLRNVAIDPGARHATTADLTRAIDAAAARPRSDDPAPNPGDPEVERRPLINDWVTGLRGLFRNSAIGNADNRGLDTPFARETYVPTALDTRLDPAITRNRPAVVFLSGNPGDGKTAFLEQARERLKHDGGSITQEDPSGREATLPDGHVVRACFDASEAAAGKGADAQLAHRLRDLEGEDFPGRPGLTAYVAINDGRLREVRDRFADLGFAGLIAETGRAVARTGDPTGGPVWVVDLKQRSYVDLVQTETPSVMRTLLDAFTAPSHWAVCDGCSAVTVCPVRANARMLALPGGDAPAARLERLLALAHLRGERHMTVRDLRSGLALLITGDLGCADVHASLAADGVAGGTSDAALAPPSEAEDGPWAATYWNTAFSTPSGRDLVLGEIRPLDPSRFPHPRLERFLYFRQRPDDAVARSALFAHGGDMPPGAHPTTWLTAAKRRLVFEGRSAPDETGDQAGTGRVDEPGAFDIARLLPYGHADRFVAALAGAIPAAVLLPDVLRGISRSDGLAGSLPGGLWLTVGASNEHGLDILKRFPIDEFSLEVARGSGGLDSLVETVPRALELRHRETASRVRLTLDLFETLARLADGLDPASQELEPLLEELGPFKSQVERSTTTELILIERGQRQHRLSRSGDVIIRSDFNTLTGSTPPAVPAVQETTAP